MTGAGPGSTSGTTSTPADLRSPVGGEMIDVRRAGADLLVLHPAADAWICVSSGSIQLIPGQAAGPAGVVASMAARPATKAESTRHHARTCITAPVHPPATPPLFRPPGRRGAQPMTTITDTNGLAAALRTLKLSGMLGTLEARLAEARAGDLGHLEFLQVLCEDEISRRSGAAIGRRLHRARFDEQATFEGFDFTASPGIPAAAIRDLAALRWLPAGEFILSGPVGVGKTFIACALGHQAIRAGHEVRFAKTSRILADLAGGRADATWDKRLRAWARPAVLICDDFGLRELTPAQADDLYELITERAGKPVIITSNRPRPTGTRCSPTRSSPSPCSTGSSTPATRSSWTDPATARTNDPAPPSAPSPRGRRPSCKTARRPDPPGELPEHHPGELRGVRHAEQRACGGQSADLQQYRVAGPVPDVMAIGGDERVPFVFGEAEPGRLQGGNEVGFAGAGADRVHGSQGGRDGMGFGCRNGHNCHANYRPRDTLRSWFLVAAHTYHEVIVWDQ